MGPGLPGHGKEFESFNKFTERTLEVFNHGSDVMGVAFKKDHPAYC